MTTETPPAPLLKEVVPTEFHDRPYLKDWLGKPQSPEIFAEVFKKLDGAEKLVGKKNGIPADDAKPEEWDTFFSKFRPEKPEDYEIPVKDPATADQEMMKIMQAALHAGNMSKSQAAKFHATIIPALEAREAARMAEQKKSDAEFETISKAALGADNAKVMERAKAALDEFAPAVLKPHLGKLDNNSLVILAGVVNAMLAKYAPEDKSSGGGAGGGTGGGTDLREEGKRLMSSDAYKNWEHPDHEKTVAKVNELYQQIGAAAKK